MGGIKFLFLNVYMKNNYYVFIYRGVEDNESH